MGASGSKSKRQSNGSAALASKVIKKAIRSGQLAPAVAGHDEDPLGQMDECAICFLHYPATNATACCSSSICTECYVQVAMSRADQPFSTLCPFCNKAQYGVIYGGCKSDALRAKERAERDAVEAALARAREEEERLAEQRREKRRSAGISSPMTPEEGSLAAEWQRAQEEEARFQAEREAHWRAALARHEAAAGSGSDDDVEELMVMQAMLLSLDPQRSDDSGDAGADTSVRQASAGASSQACSNGSPRIDGATTTTLPPAEAAGMHRPDHGAVQLGGSAESGAAAAPAAVRPGGAALPAGGALEPAVQGFRLCPPTSPTDESAAGGHQPAERGIAPATAVAPNAAQPVTVRLLTSSSSFAQPSALHVLERPQAAQAVRVTSASGGATAAASPMGDQAPAEVSSVGSSLVSAAEQQPTQPAAASDENSADEAEDASPLGPGGGAALMHQPDGSIVLVLLTAPAGIEGNSLPDGEHLQPLPLFKFACQGEDHEIAAAIQQGDAVTLSRILSDAYNQQSHAAQEADNSYRLALERYAEEDARQQQSMLDADARLKARLEEQDARLRAAV